MERARGQAVMVTQFSGGKRSTEGNEGGNQETLYHLSLKKGSHWTNVELWKLWGEKVPRGLRRRWGLFKEESKRGYPFRCAGRRGVFLSLKSGRNYVLFKSKEASSPPSKNAALEGVSLLVRV